MVLPRGTGASTAVTRRAFPISVSTVHFSEDTVSGRGYSGRRMPEEAGDSEDTLAFGCTLLLPAKPLPGKSIRWHLCSDRTH